MSITPLALDVARRTDIAFRPVLLEPVLRAAEAGKDIVPAIVSVIAKLGFTSFMYGLAPIVRPSSSTPVYYFSTLPRNWSLLYERRNYADIDPRIAVAQDECGPAPWDREIARRITPPKQHPLLDEFLENAAVYGLRSGVAWGVRNPGNHGVLVSLSSASPSFGTRELERLATNIGDVLAFGTYFHEFFIRNFVDRGMPSRLRGAALSKREIEVLGLVARGMTADDIAHKLDIAARTVRYHVDSARTKMGALNREEAIALVAKAGLISVLP